MLMLRTTTKRWLLIAVLLANAAGQSTAEEAPAATPFWESGFQGPGADPQARATRRAQRREEQVQRRLQRIERQGGPAAAMQPVGRAASAPIGGTPAGDSCPSEVSCKLELDVPDGSVLTLTGVWGAAALTCDGTKLTLPSGAGTVAPWWRCERLLAVEGTGAGYVGFTSPR
jgi:hypothetical protein